MSTMDELLSSLNEEQREAVLYNDGDSLVLAGAGSGKTRVLTTKIAYLISQGVPPYSILALTFTNKAAGEMRERIAGILGNDLSNLIPMGTFHSIFARLLRRYATRLGYESNYTIYDDGDSQTLVKQVIRDYKLDEEYYKPRPISGLISQMKNDGLSPAFVAADSELTSYFRNRRIPRFPEVYTEYQERSLRANAMDFDDLLVNMWRLLSDDEQARRECQERFRYILVDEYQDTNRVQHKIVRLLKGPHSVVCAVGDDSQSIYSFRGAVIDNILTFAQTFPGAKLFKLTKNYRSTATIVGLADDLIAKNEKRIPKEVHAVAGEGSKVSLFASFTAAAEAQTVAAKVFKQLNAGTDPEEIAVLYRTNAQSRQLEENLRIFGIPYRVFGGLSFYDRKEVKDVLAYLRLLSNPKDDEAFRRIYNVPARGIGAKTFGAIADAADSYSLPLMSVASQPELYAGSLRGGAVAKVQAFVDLMKDLSEQKEVLPPDDLLDYLLKISEIPKMYSDGSVESESKLQNIEELKNALSEYLANRMTQTNELPSLEDFVREMALYTDKDRTEEDDQPKVTLMTMHASKGLEFEHIYIVGLEEGLIPSERSTSAADIEEERRLLYVAITRAKSVCQLSFARERTLHGQTRMAAPSRFIMDLNPEYVEDYSGVLEGFSRVLKHNLSSTPTQDALPDTQPKRRITRIVGKKHIKGESQPKAEIYPTDPNLDLAQGDYVYHERFGRGTVEGFSDSVSGTKVHVDFEKEGKKVLIAKFAHLRKE